VARFVSERPIPVAGFNLGQYSESEIQSGGTQIRAYAAPRLEYGAQPAPEVSTLPDAFSRRGPRTALVVQPPPLSPARSAQTVAQVAAATLDFYSQRYGPYAYSSLALTQMPGGLSQSWPGMIYLSSFVFLTGQERKELHVPPWEQLLFGSLVEPHEIGHQWWGDLMIWRSYREQWLVEALSNYSALVSLEDKDPTAVRQALEHYRQALLSRNKAGVETADAGPVTLGARLSSSRFPDGFQAISYGRGTWLFHMLRQMMLDASGQPRGPEEPFFRALRRLRLQFEGKDITTRDVQQAFEQELPESLRFEGSKSLDWFFDGWVNGTAIPHLEATAVKFTVAPGGILVSGQILQKHVPEDLVTSVPVYGILGKRELLLGRVFVAGAQSTFRLKAPAGVHRIALDPHQTVLTRP
jgi:hypothetical protein